MQVRKYPLLLALGGIVVGFLAGFVCCSVCRQRTLDWNRLLYGDEAGIREMVAEIREKENGFYQAIRFVCTDDRRFPPISTERKELLLAMLYDEQSNEDCSFGDLSRFLALGAIEDKNPEVRSSCLWVLAYWQECLLGARHRIALNLYAESDDLVRQNKEVFLQLTGNSGEDAEPDADEQHDE